MSSNSIFVVVISNLSKVEETMLWHKRVGHISVSTISNTLKANVVQGVQLLKQSSEIFCPECPLSGSYGSYAI